MEKIKEHKRILENERTRLMDLMVKEHVRSLEEQQEQREHINSMHRMKSLEDRYQNISQQLRELQKFDDALQNSQIQKESGPPAVKDFCSQLESLVEFHYRDLTENTVSMLIKYVDNSADLIEFTDEEECGKYLDLHECHQHYIKLKDIDEVDYNTYVSTFDHLFDIPREKKSAHYCRYVKAILNYLSGYLTRVAPLFNINHEMQRAEMEFEAQWESGTFPGWVREAVDSAQTNVRANSKVSALSSWSELKSSLADLGSNFGRPIEKEDVRTVFSANNEARRNFVSFCENDGGEIRKIKDMAKHKKIATLEAMVYRFLDLVSIQRVATIEKVQRIQGRTMGEHEVADCETSANESVRKLVLDENIIYNCEICRNYTYNGPDAFRRHFLEWRHAYGMRHLGDLNAA